MISLTRDEVETRVSRYLDKLFEELDYVAQREGTKPSELARLLDQSSWGLGDDYREWFEQGDEEYV